MTCRFGRKWVNTHNPSGIYLSVHYHTVIWFVLLVNESRSRSFLHLPGSSENCSCILLSGLREITTKFLFPPSSSTLESYLFSLTIRSLLVQQSTVIFINLISTLMHCMQHAMERVKCWRVEHEQAIMRRCRKLRRRDDARHRNHTNRNLISVFRHKPIHPIRVDYESAKRLLFHLPFFKILVISFEWIFCNFCPSDWLQLRRATIIVVCHHFTRIMLINQATGILCLIGNWIECKKINESILVLLLRTIQEHTNTVDVWKRYLNWMHFNPNFFDQIKLQFFGAISVSSVENGSTWLVWQTNFEK